MNCIITEKRLTGAPRGITSAIDGCRLVSAPRLLRMLLSPCHPLAALPYKEKRDISRCTTIPSPASRQSLHVSHPHDLSRSIHRLCFLPDKYHIHTRRGIVLPAIPTIAITSLSSLNNSPNITNSVQIPGSMYQTGPK